MTQRVVTAWALGAFLIAQFLPALFFKRDWMPGVVATVFSGVGTGVLVTGDRVEVENVALSACVLGLLANLVFAGAAVTGFLKLSRITAILSGFAAANGILAVLALFVAREAFTPLFGCGVWLGAMLWLCAASCRVAYRASKSPSGTSVSQ
jgi:hypothetical protein